MFAICVFCMFATRFGAEQTCPRAFVTFYGTFFYVDGGQFCLCVKFKYNVLVIKRVSSGLGMILLAGARPAGFD